jgi:hypothetical protein
MALGGLLPPSFLVGCGLLIACGVAIMLGCLPVRLRPAVAAVLVEHLGDMLLQLRRLRVPLGHALVRLLGVLMGLLRLRLRLGRLLAASTRRVSRSESCYWRSVQLLDPLADLLAPRNTSAGPRRSAQARCPRQRPALGTVHHWPHTAAGADPWIIASRRLHTPSRTLGEAPSGIVGSR